MSAISISSDYATMDLKDGTALYYGYEYLSEDGDWQFTVTNGGVLQVAVPFSDLGAPDKFNCGECLLHGIRMWLNWAGCRVSTETPPD